MKPATAWPPVPPTYSTEKVLKKGWGDCVHVWGVGGGGGGTKEGGGPVLVTPPERGDLWSHTEWVFWTVKRGRWKSSLHLSATASWWQKHIWMEIIRCDGGAVIYTGCNLWLPFSFYVSRKQIQKWIIIKKSLHILFFCRKSGLYF